MLNNLRLFFFLLCTLGLAACQSNWVETNEGAAVNQAIMSQSVYPNGRPNTPTRSAGGLNGVAAKATIDNYQRSYVVPLLGAAAGGGAPAASAAPATTPSPQY
jgi:hypothetical protein